MSVVASVNQRVHDTALDEIRVMVVDDAVVVRKLISRWIQEAPGLALVAAMRNGREALENLDQAEPDIVLLDVDMPELDGISTLSRLIKRRRDLTVIMASALTRHDAEITLKALALGAADYIPKPDNVGGVMTSATFQRELIEKIRALGHRRRRTTAAAHRVIAPAPRRPSGAVKQLGLRGATEIAATAAGDNFALRPFSAVVPRVLLIGASTGGPQALMKLVSGLDAVRDNAPILITQHMPATFTTILAEHLSRAGGRPVAEAVNGEPVLAGRTYVAPGGRHMRVARRDGVAAIALDDGPAVNFCKPAVDPLFSSAARIWGASVLAVVLTGMGIDGTAGAAKIVAGGGSIIAQDEATSVVWGMPGSAAEAGLCSAVLPLAEIAPKVAGLLRGAGP
jgi:two-component system chemotaxis response regulator CheB